MYYAINEVIRKWNMLFVFKELTTYLIPSIFREDVVPSWEQISPSIDHHCTTIPLEFSNNMQKLSFFPKPVAKIFFFFPEKLSASLFSLHSFTNIRYFAYTYLKKRQKFCQCNSNVWGPMQIFGKIVQKRYLLEIWRITSNFVKLSAITSLWKTDFIHRTSFTPGLQQVEWQRAVDLKDIWHPLWQEKDLMHEVMTPGNKSLLLNLIQPIH